MLVPMGEKQAKISLVFTDHEQTTGKEFTYFSGMAPLVTG